MDTDNGLETIEARIICPPRGLPTLSIHHLPVDLHHACELLDVSNDRVVPVHLIDRALRLAHDNPHQVPVGLDVLVAGMLAGAWYDVSALFREMRQGGHSWRESDVYRALRDDSDPATPHVIGSAVALALGLSTAAEHPRHLGEAAQATELLLEYELPLAASPGLQRMKVQELLAIDPRKAYVLLLNAGALGGGYRLLHGEYAAAILIPLAGIGGAVLMSTAAIAIPIIGERLQRYARRKNRQ